jgi:hypothetical protein
MANWDLISSKNLDVPETSLEREIGSVEGTAGASAPAPLLYSLCGLCANTAELAEQPVRSRHHRVGGTKYITLSQATNIIEAVEFAKAIDLSLVAHLTIHWAYTNAGDDPNGKLFAKVREGLAKWLRRHGIVFAAAWCIERMSRGQAEVAHCHLLFHLPVEYRAKRKLQIEAAIYRLVKRHGRGYWAEEVIDLRIHSRKKASRGGNDFDSVRESWWLFENLRRNGVIGQIWPVYKWDDSPQIFALLDESGLGHAAEEMNEALRRVGVAEMELPTEADYRRALKDFDVAISLDDAGQRLKAAIKAFYEARKDRRIKKWD